MIPYSNKFILGVSMSLSDSLWGGFLTSLFGAFCGMVLAVLLGAGEAGTLAALSGGALIASVSAFAVHMFLSRRHAGHMQGG
ncbi:MAG: hypothetical protein Tsb008_13500 [Rhodothalassiaceae bacterium]